MIFASKPTDGAPCRLPRRAVVIALFCELLLSAGCPDLQITECRSGLICPGHQICHGDPPQCVLPSQVEDCVDRSEGEACDYGAPGDSFRCRGDVCLPADICGDGRVDPGEECEAGAAPHCIDLEGEGYQAGAVRCTGTCALDRGRCWREGWQVMDFADNHLDAVVATADGQFYASGLGGILLTFDHEADQWIPLPGHRERCDIPGERRLFGVWAAPGGDRLVAVGDNCVVVVAELDGQVVTSCSVSALCAPGLAHNFRSVWGTPTANGDFVAAVGYKIVFTEDSGQTWIEETPPTDASIISVWGRSPDEVYAVGFSGMVLQRTAAGWSLFADQPDTNSVLTDIWGPADSTDLYVVGKQGTILHYDGSIWHDLDPSRIWTGGRDWYAMDGTPGGELIVVGEQGMVGYFNGSTWSLEFPHSKRLAGVQAHEGTGDVFAVGNYGAIMRFRGATWREIEFGDNYVLRSAAILPDGRLVAGGDQGIFLQYDGLALTQMESDTTATINGLWAGEQLTLAVGSEGEDAVVSILDAGGWTTTPLDQGTKLLALAGVEDSGTITLVAVGTGGAVWWYRSGVWERDPDLTINESLYAVWVGTGPGSPADDPEVWLAGENGTTWRYGQGTWELVASPLSVAAALQPHLYGIWAGSQYVFVVGEAGAIWQLPRGEDTWQALTPTTNDTLHAIWAPPSGDEFFAVGQSGGVIYFDGQRWSPMPALQCRNNYRTIYALTGSSRSHVFAAGEYSCVVQFSGRLPSPLP